MGKCARSLSAQLDVPRDGVMTGEQENFSGLIREVRSQLGLSQEELAHALGVSFATVNRRSLQRDLKTILGKGLVREIRAGPADPTRHYALSEL